jgi:hypothetical protein
MMLGCIKQMQSDENPASAFDHERAMIEKCGFMYPSFVQCETLWIDYFRNMDRAENLFSGVTTARMEAIQEKYSKVFDDKDALGRVYSDAMTGESFTSIISYDLPLMLRRTDGISHNSYITGRAIREPRYNFDRIRSIFGWRLTQFLLGRRRVFLCPFFHSAHCKVKTERCRHSYKDLREVPLTEECRVRVTCFGRDWHAFQM